MKLTARDMSDMNVIDKIIVEPSGGAHKDWQTTMEMLAAAVVDQINELQEVPVDELPVRRAEKYLAMTRDVEIFRPSIEQSAEEHE